MVDSRRRWERRDGIHSHQEEEHDKVIKTEEQAYYRALNRVRRLIETLFSQLEEYGLRFVRAITSSGLPIKIITAILAFNI